MTYESKRYISVADTAKLIRQALKAEFPGVKFSVRSKSYSGGASVRVSWVDGPKSAEVEAIAHRFQGASFDGMIDLKSYHESELGGERVHFGADYVFCEREISPERRSEIEAKIAAASGRPFSRTERYDDALVIEGFVYTPDPYGSDGGTLVWRVFNESGFLASDESIAAQGPAAQRRRGLSLAEYDELHPEPVEAPPTPQFGPERRTCMRCGCGIAWLDASFPDGSWDIFCPACDAYHRYVLDGTYAGSRAAYAAPAGVEPADPWLGQLLGGIAAGYWKIDGPEDQDRAIFGRMMEADWVNYMEGRA